ncbi:hypothetical protein ACIGEP_01580 [Microbacterium sp. NPDC077663]|uniref:hypothetical protein n=1 Tax=Microbacterium sp. NPDC077663 TaxID=3364189 RepID=UPI0037C54292
MSWDADSSLAVVLSVEDVSVLVAPIFTDFDLEVFEDDELTDFAGCVVLVLRRYARPVAPLTLDALFGTVALPNAEITHAVIDADLEQHMIEPLNRLSQWSTHGEGTGTLRERFRSVGVTARQIASALNEPLTVAAQILRNARPVTPGQAETLAHTMPLTADEILESNPTLPPQWQRELHASSYRAPIKALARQLHKTDSDAWRSVAYGALALAARQGNDQAPESMRARIDSYLQSELSGDD